MEEELLSRTAGATPEDTRSRIAIAFQQRTWFQVLSQKKFIISYP